VPKRVEVRRGWLVEFEIARLLTAEKIPMYRAIWSVMADCGCRTSEVVAMCVGDMINLKLSRESNRIVISDRELRLNSKGAVRYVPVSTRVKRAVSDYLMQVCHITALNNSTPLFSCATRTLQRRFKHALRLAGIAGDHLCPHSLRHSYATHLLSRGVDVLTVSKMMGHRSIYTTIGYLHVSEESMRKVRDAIES